MNVMFKSKSRKITVTGKGHHLEAYNAEKKINKIRQKFNQVKDMVDEKANETAVCYREEIKFVPNNNECRWEAKHESGINLFVIAISRIGKKWVFRIFSHEKGCWENSKDLGHKSLCSTLELQLQ